MDKKDILSEIQNIVEQIIQKYKPSRIILFGSAGRGEYDKVNDLDFLIIKQDFPLYGIDRMRELDELIYRSITADMLVYRPDEFEERIKLGDPFVKTILREDQVIYGWSPFTFYAQICFHFHQAAEKHLKSIYNNLRSGIQKDPCFTSAFAIMLDPKAWAPCTFQKDSSYQPSTTHYS